MEFAEILRSWQDPAAIQGYLTPLRRAYVFDVQFQSINDPDWQQRA